MRAKLGLRGSLAVLKGLATYVAPLRWYVETRPSGGGGTEDALYCYTVWMRHICTMRGFGWQPAKKRVCELGPGRSAGVGVAALMSGADSYLGFDAVRYPFSKSQAEFVAMVGKMALLYAERHPIPGPDEYPGVVPYLQVYNFPSWLQQDSIDSWREAVTEELTQPPRGDDGFARLRYIAPYANIDHDAFKGCFDAVFSQAVLEHVVDVQCIYNLMFSLLKPGGWSWHVIDFRCHGLASEWNGHWVYSDALWKVMVGRRKYFLNRLPLSEQIKAAERAGFKVEAVFRFVEGESPPLGKKSRLSPNDFAAPYRNLSAEDMSTQGAMVVLQKA